MVPRPRADPVEAGAGPRSAPSALRPRPRRPVPVPPPASPPRRGSPGAAGAAVCQGPGEPGALGGGAGAGPESRGGRRLPAVPAASGVPSLAQRPSCEAEAGAVPTLAPGVLPFSEPREVSVPSARRSAVAEFYGERRVCLRVLGAMELSRILTAMTVSP
ncbi:translation initiation factor IF-2-like [Vulpes lagopus]|uniref:translation initiation factor IF-2-like n=1 Tax=Vulpes lagopus TaxID=494514 RepID=UPI001BCA024C|nr:translation initiation factor IF-2-like [Vulpes lagopus]